MNVKLIFELLLVPAVLTQTGFSTGDRCGSANNGLMCNPELSYGPCCSEYGYCGSTPAYCSKANKCQSGCTETKPITTKPPLNCGDGFCDARSETCTSCPQDCGSCNNVYIDKCKNPGHITLTFDDGPSENTPNLLRVAKEQNVKISLFVIGNKLSNPNYRKYLLDAYEQGHVIASQTFTHPIITQITDDELRQEMIKADDAIYRIIKQRPIFMRSPYADTEPRTMSVLESMNYLSIFTSLDSEDTVHGNSDPKKILQLVKVGLQKSNPRQTGLVLTQHEIYNVSINYLPDIVREIKNNGFQIVPLHTCFGVPSPYRQDKCGDSVCSGYVENCSTCPQDCGVCPSSQPPALTSQYLRDQ